MDETKSMNDMGKVTESLIEALRQWEPLRNGTRSVPVESNVSPLTPDTPSDFTGAVAYRTIMAPSRSEGTQEALLIPCASKRTDVDPFSELITPISQESDGSSGSYVSFDYLQTDWKLEDFSPGRRDSIDDDEVFEADGASIKTSRKWKPTLSSVSV